MYRRPETKQRPIYEIRGLFFGAYRAYGAFISVDKVLKGLDGFGEDVGFCSLVLPLEILH